MRLRAGCEEWVEERRRIDEDSPPVSWEGTGRALGMEEGRRCPQEGAGGGLVPLAMSKVSTVSWTLTVGVRVGGDRCAECPLPAL